jgi:myo-inositol 2-dehydrogenase/D-chiro-inositol 1-dehydrogenase
LIKSIRSGEPLNEGRNVALSTMTAILGRMSTYTGRELTWDWAMNDSKLDLSPPKYTFGELPIRPVAMPDKTEPI